LPPSCHQKNLALLSTKFNLRFEPELVGTFAQKSIKNSYLFIFFPTAAKFAATKIFYPKGRRE
jgi:hypothetical protein